MNYFVTLGIILFVYMNLWFVVSLVLRRNDAADIAWGLGFVLLAWTSFGLSGGYSLLGIIVSILVTIWGTRLAWHIYRRNRGKPEDHRYQAWRRDWGKWFVLRSYFQIYILQGVLLYLISVPVLMINQSNSSSFGILAVLGILVWLIGFGFESIGDWQLAQFLKNPKNKGKLMTSGLWRYTRHPNYFGEVTQWWGIWLVALSVPMGWIAVIGPITITYLILKVSGIPMLEKKMSQHPDFAAYGRTTNAFFPWWPKEEKSS